MMNKKKLPFLLALVGALLMGSCSDSDEPTIASDVKVNEGVYSVMEKDYYWSVPANPNTTLTPNVFFNSLLNAQDIYTVDGLKYNYSRLFTKSQLEGTTYDIGFNYGLFRYSSGVLAYVIFYVKPGTDAASNGLQRGFTITKVNDTTIDESNYRTLLSDAYAKGNPVKLYTINPETEIDYTVTVKPDANYKENPVYLSKTIPVATEKLGYIVYNAFNSTYNSQLNDALQSVSGVNYLVLDMRYNTGGSQVPAQIIGSAVVSDKKVSDTFIMVDKREGLQDLSIPFVSGYAQLSNLKKVYVIIGQNTAGMPEVLINSLKPYLNDKLVLVGDASTQGRNMSVGTDSSIDPYIMNLVIGKWANKDLATFGAIKPNIEQVQDTEVLKPLGSEDETMLAAIISNITGVSRTRSVGSTVSNVFSGSLVDQLIRNGGSTLELDTLDK